ncbi:hypothetical protein GDO81_001271 [Engystomops pustulosus]|uniref:Uncharacterized protein n=1 Tax=Engystomops pustulosus TaxID=76066 RepID=A0AAV7DDF0_ENGPU|nr:hypothetical protein GDO81_001271 [Engystomops pustulosus]
MSVVRLSSLSRLLREQVVPGNGLCLTCRRVLERGCHLGSTFRFSSSARPKDEIGTSERCRLELVEVLQSRVEQLKADETLYVHEPESKKAHPNKESGKVEENSKIVQTPKRWMEKLKKEQITKHQKQKVLHEVKSTDKTSFKKEKSHALGKLTKGPMKLESMNVEIHPSTSNHVLDKDMEIGDNALNQGNGLLLEDKDGNRHGGVQRHIHCYLDTCIFMGELSRAQNCLQFYHQHISRRGLLNISMYNLLMRAWAKEASLAQVGRLFVMLNEASLKPNLGSYAAALEAMGRTESNTKAIQRCLKQLEEDGMSVEELFHGLPYIEDERDMVLKAIQRVIPDFKPPPRVEIICTSPMVKNFYSKVSKAKTSRYYILT